MNRLISSLIGLTWVLSCLGLTACQPQATSPGAPSGILTAIGGGGTINQAAPNTDKTTADNADATSTSPSAGSEQTATSSPNIRDAQPQMYAYNTNPSGMQSGSAAPIHDPQDDAAYFLHGSKTGECSLPNGLIRVHIEARIFARGIDREELPVTNSAGDLGLRFYYRESDSARTEASIDVPLQFPPSSPTSIQAIREPRNYVDASVTTVQSDSIRVRLIVIDPLVPDQPHTFAHTGPLYDETTDTRPADLPACVTPQMTTKGG